MDMNEIKAKIQALLFVSSEPLSIAEIKKVLDSTLVVEKEEEAPVEELAAAEEGAPVNTDEAPVVDVQAEEVVLEAVQVEELVAQEVPQEPVEQTVEQDVLAQLKAANQELNEEISKNDIKTCLDELIALYHGPEHGFELAMVAKGYQFRTKNSMAPVIRKIYKLPKPRLSAPSMETLAIVAYQQPITRNKIEEIRGVDTGGVLKTLLEKDLVKIVGRSEEPGRPIVYGTSKAFLETFSLSSLAELPTLKDLETLNATLSDSSAVSDEEVSEESEGFGEELSFDNSLDLESNELLGDLDASLNSLKSLETEIFTAESSEQKTDEAQPTE